jgi:hypothetical protein
MDRNEVAKLVIEYADQYGPTNRPERKAVEKELKSTDGDELFKGLFSLFLLENDRYSYIRQQNAGVILYKLKPKAFFDLKERIRSCLSTWDASVEELPLYFSEKCGKHSVLEVIGDLKSEELSETERNALGSFMWSINIQKNNL